MVLRAIEGAALLPRKRTVEEILSFASGQSPRPSFVVLFGDLNHRRVYGHEDGLLWLEE